MIVYSVPSTFVSLPVYLPKRTRSPVLTSSGTIWPSSSLRPRPTATTSPSCGFSFAESGIKMPLRMLSSSSLLFTMMRSYSGLTFMGESPSCLPGRGICKGFGFYCGCFPARCFRQSDRREPRVVSNEPLNLVGQLLPVLNEIAGLISSQHLTAFLLENSDYSPRLQAIGYRLSASHGLESFRYAVEFGADERFDFFCPLYLAFRTKPRRRGNCAHCFPPAKITPCWM